MDFRISGRIAETESGKGIKGLLVRARDRDLLFDDLLGNATTDEQGAFEIAYGEKDFRELFDAKPDIYLSVYAPPSRLLAETADAIRWDASKHERFDLKIPRDRLGPVSPELPDDMVAAGIDLPAEAVRLERAGAFDLPRIEGFTTAGRPGSPAVPVTTHYVALPEGGDILDIEVHAGAPVMLAGRSIRSRRRRSSLMLAPTRSSSATASRSPTRPSPSPHPTAGSWRAPRPTPSGWCSWRASPRSGQSRWQRCACSRCSTIPGRARTASIQSSAIASGLTSARPTRWRSSGAIAGCF